MKTGVRIAITAYFNVEDIGDAEKEASFIVEIGAGRKIDWTNICGRLIQQALDGMEEFPYPIKLMAPAEVEKFLDRKEARSTDVAETMGRQ